MLVFSVTHNKQTPNHITQKIIKKKKRKKDKTCLLINRLHDHAKLLIQQTCYSLRISILWDHLRMKHTVHLADIDSIFYFFFANRAMKPQISKIMFTSKLTSHIHNHCNSSLCNAFEPGINFFQIISQNI